MLLFQANDQHRRLTGFVMDMEVTAWMSLHHAMNARDSRPFSKATLRRIGGSPGRTSGRWRRSSR